MDLFLLTEALDSLKNEFNLRYEAAKADKSDSSKTYDFNMCFFFQQHLAAEIKGFLNGTIDYCGREVVKDE